MATWSSPVVTDNETCEPSRHWYALRAKPHKESSAAALLERAGLEVYVPKVKVKLRPYSPPTVEPLFPGYLFGRLSAPLGELRLARYTPGILYVVGYGEEPWPLPDSFIANLQERIVRSRGFIGEPDYHPGERVIITRGPLRDVEAIFEERLSASGRVRVLINILKRLCRAEVHVSDLRRTSKAAVVA
jgi:transcriptional antiterminator RfaH